MENSKCAIIKVFNVDCDWTPRRSVSVELKCYPNLKYYVTLTLFKKEFDNWKRSKTLTLTMDEFINAPLTEMIHEDRPSVYNNELPNSEQDEGYFDYIWDYHHPASNQMRRVRFCKKQYNEKPYYFVKNYLLRADKTWTKHQEINLNEQEFQQMISLGCEINYIVQSRVNEPLITLHGSE